MSKMLFGRASALALTVALAAGVTACATAPAANDGLVVAQTAPTAVNWIADSHSYARPADARVGHVDLDLKADFGAKILSGTATLDVTGRPGVDEVILDVRMLDIRAVTDASGQPLAFSLGTNDPIKGQALSIKLPVFTGSEVQKVTITYATRSEASALQWLTPEQTAGKRLPFMFSQGQAILTRTWIPTQDSPGIRQTYTARIEAPADQTVVMAAEQLTPVGEGGSVGHRAWRFKMDKPIPPYLIAIGIGDLAFAKFDDRTGVWAEPVSLEASRAELEPTAQMVHAAEALYGPYLWGRYDLLMLPPSFPFGGMENPMLTFATPTIIAGDRSLVSLVAHELAHSWSGNLVTNANWDDFWLNEGFTSYFENRIMEAVYGRDAAVQEQVLAWNGLQDELRDLKPEDTRLHLDLTGRDPDEGMNTIAYDKGAAFLRTIEETAGRPAFDAWMRGYFERNAFVPMTSEMFLADIRQHLVKGDAAMDQALQLETWVYQSGLPSNAKAPVSSAFIVVDQAADAFYVAKGPASAIPWAAWNTQQRQRFLNWRPQATGTNWLTEAQLADLNQTLNLNAEGNSEVRFAWLQVALAHRYEPSVASAEAFLTSMGRRKFVLPLFQTLWNQGDWGKAHATRIYATARPLYHPVTTGSVDAVVGRN